MSTFEKMSNKKASFYLTTLDSFSFFFLSHLSKVLDLKNIPSPTLFTPGPVPSIHHCDSSLTVEPTCYFKLPFPRGFIKVTS